MSDYRLVPSENPQNWTTAVVLERDDDGNPSKVVTTGIPVSLNAEDRKTVEKLGFSTEQVSKEDAEAEATKGAGDDVAGATTTRKDNDK